MPMKELTLAVALKHSRAAFEIFCLLFDIFIILEHDKVLSSGQNPASQFFPQLRAAAVFILVFQLIESLLSKLVLLLGIF